jgi:hypothetical protein
VTVRSVYDPLLGYSRYAGKINKQFSYHKKIIIRKTNKIGYFDKDHAQQKTKYRIGFFGDSFTESLQVPLEDTFFSLVENKLRDLNVECLAFGRSGYGTLHSYAECQRWMNYFDLDLVVYVFYENDLGDQIKEIKRAPNLCYAELSGSGYSIHKSPEYRVNYSYAQQMASYLKFHSVLLTNISQRLGLLFIQGASLKADAHAGMMSAGPGAGDYPHQDDLPSTWPPSIREYAENLGALIIRDFRNYVQHDKKKFVILYIPRESEFMKDAADQDSWKSWIAALCNKEKIDFIDPTDALLAHAANGEFVFFGHFTEYGHQAVAEAFSVWFRSFFTKQ